MVYSPSGRSDLFLILECMTDLQLVLLELSTLSSSSLWKTDTIVFSKLNKPPVPINPHSNGLEINEPRGDGLNRGFTVFQLVKNRTK